MTSTGLFLSANYKVVNRLFTFRSVNRFSNSSTIIYVNRLFDSLMIAHVNRLCHHQSF